MAPRLDLFLLLFFGLVIINSIRGGLLKTAFDICAVFMSIYIGSYLAEILSGAPVNSLSYAYFFMTFCFLAYVAMGFFIYILLKLIKISFLGMIDLIGSVVLGICKAVFILGLVIWAMQSMPLPDDINAEVKGSVFKDWTVPILAYSYNTIFSLVPKNDLFPQPKTKPQFSNEEINGNSIREAVEKEVPVIKQKVKDQTLDMLENMQ